jgi:hypothetical protein
MAFRRVALQYLLLFFYMAGIIDLRIKEKKETSGIFILAINL